MPMEPGIGVFDTALQTNLLEKELVKEEGRMRGPFMLSHI